MRSRATCEARDVMGHGTKPQEDDSGLLRRGTAALPELARATPAPDASHVYGCTRRLSYLKYAGHYDSTVCSIYIHVESPLVCIPIAGARLMRIEARIVLLVCSLIYVGLRDFLYISIFSLP